MKVEQVNTNFSGYFVATEDNNEAGKLIYKWDDPTTMVILSTAVNSAFKGRGVGKDLVVATAEYAKENGIKIIAQCPYAKGQLEKMPEYSELLK